MLLAALLLACAAAQAGTACDPHPASPASLRQGMDLALQVRDALDASGAEVALIGRVGQDLSKYGLRYSHMGIAWRDHPRGRWLVVHELNACGSAESGLYNDGLGNFFLDDLFDYEALLVIPSPSDQHRIAQALAGPLPARLHEARYNMLSYAWSTRYQNSNQWVLETYAAALGEGVAGREEAQRWLRREGYAPITVPVPALTRLGARMFRANVAFDDHPFDRRMAGQIDTVTVESVERFVRRRDPGAATRHSRLGAPLGGNPW
ncbi:MAG TPA: DUF2145 domain-containing protein [Telluria sp.]|nr:DUF2145 domain-containing protein [Telluria sp.]